MSPVYKLSANSVKNGRTVYGSMLAGNTAYTPPFDFESIATVTVGSGGAANVEFTNIPSTYTHLQIRFIAKNVATISDGSWMYMEVNGNTGASYGYHRLNGNGADATAAGTGGATRIQASYMLFTTGGYANMYGGGVIDILDYKDTNKNKTIRGLVGADVNGAGNVTLFSGFWAGSGSTNAITSLKFYSDDSRNLAQYSHFALYGIKGAA